MAFNVEVSEKVEQPLMSRTVLKGVVVYDAAPPSFVELKKHFASAMKVDESLVVVQHLNPVFGMGRSSMEAHIYKSKDAISSFASKVIVARNKPRVKKVAAAAAEK
ncbi:hypothetical protein HYY73_06670 [Candidatus Woesearchaeota archaeon]|nr:hypothetical protein [Candidatus Woesearchaeota archaeon]